MSHVRTFQMNYRKKARISIKIEAESDHEFSGGIIFKSNLKYRDLRNVVKPIKGMLKLKVDVEDWLVSIKAISIKSIEFEGSLFLGYFVVKDFLLKKIAIQETKQTNIIVLPKFTNYIFIKYEEFVQAAISNSFSNFPNTIVACNSCKIPSKLFEIEKNSKLSVIIPTKGESFETLDRLLCLISTQVNATDELILVDDNSQKVNEFENLTHTYSNLILIRGRCSGVSDARNIGLNQATGELISFVDSDDYISEDFFKIQRLIHFIHPVIAATGTWIKAFGAHSKVYQQWDNFSPLGMRMCLPPAGVLMWKKAAIFELNSFDSNFYEGFEDFELVTRSILNNHLIVVVDSIEYFYQRGQKSLSQSWDFRKEIDLKIRTLMNSKKLCEHKFFEYLSLELEFGKELNHSSLDLIFNRITAGREIKNIFNRYRNNYFLLNIWKALPKFFRVALHRFISE